jgi:malonate-semialdehyde dehydrogenase (acetylating) / methylmalonate-semialdehyde dehydrogenase
MSFTHPPSTDNSPPPPQVEKYPLGNFVGPTIVSGVTGSMGVYRTEVFGPVLCCVAVQTLTDAIQFVNANEYGNGCALFTRSGAAARKFAHEIEVGQVLHFFCTPPSC